MHRLTRILLLEYRQPAAVRWLETTLLFGLAVGMRFQLGSLEGANPALVFFPAVLIAAVALGWLEATAVLLLSVLSAFWFFLPAGTRLLPVGWLLVGSLNIGIIAGLRSLGRELAEANERQRVMFQELQHRVANTLQSAVVLIDMANRRINSGPEDASRLLREASHRLTTSADVHRRLSDPTLFDRRLNAVLQDAVASVIDQRAVHVTLDVDELDLTLDQMSAITMLVIEGASNSQKHVFQHSLGANFSVVLKAGVSGRAKLLIQDDGPCRDNVQQGTEVTLGMGILHAMARQLRGLLSISTDRGTVIAVEFPI